MSEIKSYKDLKVWQKGMDLAEKVYLFTNAFPKTELYCITSQMRRAAVSIVSNIAEGNQRDSTAEFLYFLSVSQGSLAELETQILLSVRLNYLTGESAETMLTISKEIGRMLIGLRKSLKAHI